MAILRSPSRTRASRRSTRRRPRRCPGVVAVVTGELMAQHNLAWMPTLSGDTQAVLATDKVRFQGQEVAAVIADRPVHRAGRARADRRRLRRRCRAVIDAAAGARRRRAADPRRQGGPDRQPRLPLGVRRPGGDRRARSRRPTGRRQLDTLLPALAPVAARDVRVPRRRQPGHRPGDDLHDLAGAARAPHPVRDRGRACPSRTSGSSRPTSAAASATRCRCTRATWSRRRRRS